MSDDAGLPGGLEHFSNIVALIGRRTPAFFLDFDGTLAPLETTPTAAAMPEYVRDLVARLAAVHIVCIASGRGLADIRAKVGLSTVYYAADHGHHISGPGGSGIELEIAPEDTLELERASYALESRLREVRGAVVETKGLSISVHFRLVAQPQRALVEQIVRAVAGDSPGLRLARGKLVYELTPDLGWNKGKALLWLLKRLGFRRSAVCPVCLGDDRTDEDMFRAAKGWGVSLIVGEIDTPTQADYRLNDPGQVRVFLERLTEAVSQSSGRRG